MRAKEGSAALNLSNPIHAVIPTLDGEVLTVLARTVKPLSGSRIAALLARGSYPGARLVLARLVDEGLVNVEQVGAALLYTANRSHILWPPIESLAHAADQMKRELYDRISGLVASVLGQDQADHVSVAVFGSVARGTSDQNSDIDLVIVVPDDMDTETGAQLLDSMAVEVRSWTGNDCNIYSLTDSDLSRLVTERDPMINSWQHDAVAIHGPVIHFRMAAAAEASRMAH